MNVLIINQCSTNIGDRAVLYFILEQLKANSIEDITVSASKPQYWQSQKCVKSLKSEKSMKSPFTPFTSIAVVPWGWDVSRKANAGFIGKVLHKLFKVKLPKLIWFPLARKSLSMKREKVLSHLSHLNSFLPFTLLRCFINSDFKKAIEKADLVISTGGHHLTTIIAKSIKTPQIFDMAVALLYKKPLVLWSQSVGSFNFKRPSEEAMIQKILAEAEQIYVRDNTSESEIRRLAGTIDESHQKTEIRKQNSEHRRNIQSSIINNKYYSTYESVFGLYDLVKSRILPSARPNVIGISVWTGNKSNKQAYEHYISCFAGLIKYAIDKTGCKVKFFPMEMEGSDRRCIEDIINVSRMSKINNKLSIINNQSDSCETVEGFPCTPEHINAVSQCRMFIGHKTHSQIFALVAATPLLAIAYHAKTEDFMAQFGLEDCCINDSNLNLADLTGIFDRIVDNLDSISYKQQEVACRMSKQVKQDFAQMLQKQVKR
jgi:colanic acid/amylovoran biosynthesis protein